MIDSIAASTRDFFLGHNWSQYTCIFAPWDSSLCRLDHSICSRRTQSANLQAGRERIRPIQLLPCTRWHTPGSYSALFYAVTHRLVVDSSSSFCQETHDRNDPGRTNGKAIGYKRCRNRPHRLETTSAVCWPQRNETAHRRN